MERLGSCPAGFWSWGHGVSSMVMQGALVDLELQLNSYPARTSDLPAGVVVFITGPTGIVVHPDGGLLYYPEPPQVPEVPTGAFAEAEHAEFARADLVAAENVYTALASGGDTAVRVGALAGLARVHRKGQRPDAALAAYDELSRISGVRVAGLPPGLVARAGRARVFEDTGRTPELRDEAATLDHELRSGRWRLTKSQYHFYSAEVRRWMGHSEAETATVDPDAVALAEAAQWLWDRRPWEEGPTSRARLSTTGPGRRKSGAGHLECVAGGSQGGCRRSELSGLARSRGDVRK